MVPDAGANAGSGTYSLGVRGPKFSDQDPSLWSASVGPHRPSIISDIYH
jgi:hypothetical protein